MSIPSQNPPPPTAAVDGVDPSLDPAEFDADAWISAVERPTAEVSLYNPDPAWDARFDAAHAEYQRIDAALVEAQRADADPDRERSITEASVSEELRVELRRVEADLIALRDEQEARALVVTVRQMLPDDYASVIREAQANEVPTAELDAHALAAGIVAMTAPGPDGKRVKVTPFTGAQLHRLQVRDATGRENVRRISTKIDSISARPTVPTWPGSSISRGTGTSSAR